MIKVSLVVLHWKVFELYVNMNLSPKSRCQVKRRQVNKRVFTKLVTPKFYDIATWSKAAKSTAGPLAKALLSQGRSSETRPLGNECAARRLGDLRTLLAIQSQRLPGLLLSSKVTWLGQKNRTYVSTIQMTWNWRQQRNQLQPSTFMANCFNGTDPLLQ